VDAADGLEIKEKTRSPPKKRGQVRPKLANKMVPTLSAPTKKMAPMGKEKTHAHEPFSAELGAEVGVCK
jgi:hypothetical protein